MRCHGLSRGFYVVLCLLCCSAPYSLSAQVNSPADSSASRLSESTRRRFEQSLRALSTEAAEQEQLLSEAGEELSRMRTLLDDSRQRRNELEQSLDRLSAELNELDQSNEASSSDLMRLQQELGASQNALESLERSFDRYRRTVRVRRWSERGIAAGLIILSFFLGSTL